MQRPLLVSVRDAAKLLAISERTVLRLISQGDLASIKVRRRRMVKMSGLIALAENGTDVELLKNALSVAGERRHEY